MADERNYTSAHDDPSAQIWTSFLNEAHRHDQSLARRWKGDMDSILIFAGLFSASVTAFIIESYKTLTPQPEDMTVQLLAQISGQLSTMTNSSIPTSAWQPALAAGNSNSPATSSIVCNTLWFLSLAFSLASALSATLVEQWVRMYLQATESRASIHERARISSYLYQGIKRFRMSELVETIPMLLHISLLLFFAGLVEFLRPVNYAMSYLILGMLVACIALYFGATVLPLFQYDCPYRTPLSSLFWQILKSLHLFHYTDSEGIMRSLSGSIQACAERAAVEICDERDERDLDAMAWTLKALRQDSELEGFVSVIPRAVVGFDYSAKLLLTRLLRHKDLNVRLSHRIPRLLISCIGGVMDPTAARKRALACLSAIWSLCMMSVPTHEVTVQVPLAFDEFTLRDIHTVRNEMEAAVEGHANSATAVVARAILDMHLDATFITRTELYSKLSRSDMSPEEFASYELPVEALEVAKRTRAGLDLLAEFLHKPAGICSPIFMVYLNGIGSSLQDLLSMSRRSCLQEVQYDLQSEALDLLEDFRSLLNQAGFALAVEYASTAFISTELPHEPFNTMRRLLFKVDFEEKVPVKLQERYVKFLHSAFESRPNAGSHLPPGITNMLLALSKSLTDKALVVKARHTITRSVLPLASEGEAHKALDHLARMVPPSDPALDLFTSHMYATVRLDKSPLFHTPNDATSSPGAGLQIPRRKHETA